ncbi:MAG: formylglycine-generating enzyme family protein [Polyangiaceae bacterium]
MCRTASIAFVTAFVAACGQGVEGVGVLPLADAGHAGSGDGSSGAGSFPPLDGGAPTGEDGASVSGSTAPCVGGATRCAGNGVEACGSNGQWSVAVACASSTPACAEGACVEPPSCAVSAMGTTNCGASSESCCASVVAPSGTYDRTYTSGAGGAANLADPASVSGFRLDKYLVTVGRFRQFVNAITASAGLPPANGSGIHTHLNGGRGLANSGSPGSFETGWDAANWDSEIPTGPSGSGVWDCNLTDCLSSSTWTNPAGTQENLPITCVDWYEAYAFCIWDGGFLPSEAEWEYVAAGGSQQREYPWGSTGPGTGNEYAIYGCYYGDGDAGTPAGGCTGTSIAPVGTAVLGAGYWGQLDLAGEVFEWNIDWYAPYVDPCTDCAYLSSTTVRVIRGGNYGGVLLNLQAENRDFFEDPTDHDSVIGFRCARSP